MNLKTFESTYQKKLTQLRRVKNDYENTLNLKRRIYLICDSCLRQNKVTRISSFAIRTENGDYLCPQCHADNVVTDRKSVAALKWWFIQIKKLRHMR